MPLARLISVMVALLCFQQWALAASITVAPADAPAAAKKKADLVCDGKDDQEELLASITMAPRVKVLIDRPLPKKGGMQQIASQGYGRHSVEWLPGVYHLSKTLLIPDCADMVIRAEGTYFQYAPKEGDAVRIQGMHRCRYSFGVIELESPGAALRIKPTAEMPALMSFVQFQGMIGHGKKGVGLWIDPSVENVCTNRFDGTDIAGFNVGVLVDDAAEKPRYGIGKADSNSFWLMYVRMCNTVAWEKSRGIDDSVWFIGPEACEPDSIAVRTGAAFGKWYLILGTWDWHSRPHEGNKTRSIVLDPGAQGNVFEVHPPVKIFAPVEDNSGNATNRILSTDLPPLDQPIGKFISKP